VQDHYKVGDLMSRVQQALADAGLGEGPLSWADLSPFDQFHVGGLAATKELADLLTPGSGYRILDVGSGLGGPTRFIKAHYGGFIIGLDLNPDFVAVATMLAERTGQSSQISQMQGDLPPMPPGYENFEPFRQLKYVQGDALDMPFEDASFDMAITQHVAMNIADRRGLYTEIKRVLGPGCTLAIYDVVKGNDEPLIFPVPWASEPSISHLLTVAEMRGLLTELGFKESYFADKTEEGIRWFEESILSRKDSDVKPALGLHVVMGPGFAGAAANLLRNLKEGRAAIVQTIWNSAR